MFRPALRTSIIFTFLWIFMFHGASSAQARGEILGIHILHPSELTKADTLLENGDDKDKFVTVPLTLADLEKRGEWQAFLDECHRLKIRPLVRLTTRFEDGHWIAPDREHVMAYAKFLSSLEWHRPELTIIAFNEPNHAKEWGGEINPEDFAAISRFTFDWFATEKKDYTILPAAMDLAADGRNGTMEAFAFWRRALAHEPALFDRIEGWNSHSYPNPAFSSSPLRTDKMSLRGYEHELAFIKNYTSKALPVYITETGWNASSIGNRKLTTYFRQAYESIWKKDERIVAVTPFLLQGAPGTFAPFSFLDKDGKPTQAYLTYKQILSTTN